MKTCCNFDNRELGDSKSVEIELNNEIQIIKYWLQGRPLKLITHGWLGSDKSGDVVLIKTGNSKPLN